ncbi:ATPase, partial [Photobacterium iliopiscarium]
SSLVARRAHNPKVVGSNPAPATNPLFLKEM